jgi:hypothetical protein
MSERDTPPGGPDGEREALIEALAGAHRGRTPFGEVRPHPAFFDLDEAGRKEAFDLATKLREMEAALDAEGLSTTARAVLGRIWQAGG